jgi:hypothetical protein
MVQNSAWVVGGGWPISCRMPSYPSDIHEMRSKASNICVKAWKEELLFLSGVLIFDYRTIELA